MRKDLRIGKNALLSVTAAALLLCLCLFASAGKASESGMWGTCPWRTEPNYKLIIGEEGKTTRGANTGGVSPWASLNAFVHEVVILGDVILPEDSSYLFHTDHMASPYSWNLNHENGSLNTSNVKNMSHILPWGHIDQSTYDYIGTWDTKNVTDMSYLFYASQRTRYYQAGELQNGQVLDLSGWNTSRVTNMAGMFCGFANLTALELGEWDTSRVTDMSAMFSDCFVLKDFDPSGWDTSKVTDMSSMFIRCAVQKDLDLSHWNTSSVTNMRSLFRECWNLKSLDLSGWDTRNVVNMDDMFFMCDALTTVKLGENFIFSMRQYGNLEMLPEGYWRSEADGKIYMPEQIARERSGAADTYTRLEAPEDDGFYLLTKGDEAYSIESFSYRNGSLIPVAAVPQEGDTAKSVPQYCSAMKLKLNTVLLEAGEIRLILPEGFSFSYDEVLTEKTCDVVPGDEIAETVYAFSLASAPPTVVFRTEGAAEKQIIVPVKAYGNQKKIRSETGIFDVEISASPDYWWDMKKEGFDEDKCWLADVLSFTVFREVKPDAYTPADALVETPVEALRNIGFVDIETVSITDDDQDIHQLACYFGVRTVVKDGEVRHIVCMLNSGHYNSAQWLSNFMFDTLENIYTGDEDLGFERGRHQGFDRAALRMESNLLDYCRRNKILPQRSALFATGHSRAAAVSSMIVHDVRWADHPALNSFKDAVAYTFACPNTTKKLTDTWDFDDPNIHNICYINDIVTFVPSWSLYHKYGNSYYFGEIGEKNNALMTVIMFYAQGMMTLMESGWQTGAMLEKHVVIPIAEAVRDGVEEYLENLKNIAQPLASRDVFDTITKFKLGQELWDGHASTSYLNREICKPHALDYSGAHALWSAKAMAQCGSVGKDLVKNLGIDATKYVTKKAGEVVYDTFSEAYACELWLWDRIKDAVPNSKSFLLFACPVDITLKSADGTVIAKFVDHELKECDPVYVTAVGTGDVSCVIVRDGIDYTAEITGTDIGSMDINAVTLDEKQRVAASYAKENIPVYIGEEYLLKAENALDVSDLKLEATAQIQAQGRLENDFLWTLYDSGRLSIEGTGAMPDTAEGALPAYDPYKADVKTVEFGPEVTSVGANALRGFEALEKALIPGSVTKVSEGAFAGCTRLAAASYGAGAVKFRREPIDFSDNDNLKNAVWDFDNQNVMQEIEGLRRMNLPKETRTVGDGAFAGALAEVIYVDEKCTSIGSRAFADNGHLLCVLVPKAVTVPEDAVGGKDVILIGY